MRLGAHANVNAQSVNGLAIGGDYSLKRAVPRLVGPAKAATREAAAAMNQSHIHQLELSSPLMRKHAAIRTQKAEFRAL